MPRLRVIADDLTGACDVGAALTPWPGGVTVSPGHGTAGRASPGEGDAVVVRNTQSRTLEPGVAAERVTEALADLPPGFDGIVLKKVDTGLRGPLGAELDAALDALGAGEAFVLPAIPEVGRTTERGHQLIEGVPVHRTAFGRDPQNPVCDSEVAAVIETTSRRGAAAVHLDAVRSGAMAAAIDEHRRAGAELLVCDACTADDLARAVRCLLARPRPLLLAGSVGLAAALRQALVGEVAAGSLAGPSPAPVNGTGDGILVIVGSAHPRAHAQLAHAREAGLLAAVAVDEDPAGTGLRAAGRLAAGEHVALVAPARPVAGGSAAVLAALRQAAAGVLARRRPRGLVLVGGETAFVVLEALGHPALRVDGRLGPLTVRARLAEGRHAGMAVVTKGGSSGEDDLLRRILTTLEGGGA